MSVAGLEPTISAGVAADLCLRPLGHWNGPPIEFIRGINDARQTDILTTEPLVPEPIAFEVEMAIEKLKRHKLSGMD